MHITPVMYYYPSGKFAITLTAILIGMGISAALGAGVSLGTTIYRDYKDDGQLFNGSIGVGEYFGNTLGGAVAGAGISVATVLGMGVGAAILGGTALTVMGTSLSFGAAFYIGVGTAAVAGGLGYLTKTFLGGKQFSYQDLAAETALGAFYGGIGFIAGIAGGATGFRPLSLTKNFYQIAMRTIIEGVFIWPMKGIISTLR